VRGGSFEDVTLFLAALHATLASRRLSRSEGAATHTTSRDFAVRADSGSIAAAPAFFLNALPIDLDP
jgi:hypothetical protein